MRLLLILTFFIIGFQATAHPLPMRERAALVDELLEDRLTHLLPQLMTREGIDMWVLISREYNEDPVLKTMLPSTWLSARRRTILVLFNPGQGKPVERLAIARYDVGNAFKKAWDKEKQPDQWQALKEVIEQRAPASIAINKSANVALADGITATEYEELQQVLGSKWQAKLVPAQPLAIAWLETRSEKEMALYPSIVAMGHKLIATAFSNQVITPGKTTTEDVVWWLREQSQAMKLDNWFHPTVSIQRASGEKFDHLSAFSKNKEEQVIQPGDLLHVDFGITYLRLNTDQQQHAYVLRPGETDAPDYLYQAMASANRLQDIFTANFKAGRTGNEVLKMSRQMAIEEGIKPAIYSHPIGYHGHAAGTTLGMWDAQDGVPGSGDYPLHLNTAYSIELNAASFIQAWNKEIRIMLEEDAYFDKQGVRYLHGRQTGFHLIQSE
ncbi:M24 family metallopeptidase [Aliiglaciecola sp. CAU 1673]|uniref:M24 family metallopeptidase n=1 Tax=Aliiglaciecola sp. CAU 1673 TaxID=3032595 RepID=UPI0023DC19C8|nr:M24 family metallopeptidase [Aliiglaciecola sp. CAU 1673]MDF2177428.1 M24 family metallopeptidase [Aliiglaciecola sp. CAU 1673]